MPYIGIPDPVLISGYNAAADLSALQYRFMKRTAANTANKTTADTDLIVGVLYNKPDAAGEPCEIAPPGQVVMLQVDGSGTAITAGARLTSDSVGRGIVTTTNVKRANAIALDDSAAAGDIIAVALIPSDVSL